MRAAGHKRGCRCAVCSPATRKKGLRAARRALRTNPAKRRRRSSAGHSTVYSKAVSLGFPLIRGELSPFDAHRLMVALNTLEMPAAMRGVMGGLSTEEAAATVRELTGLDPEVVQRRGREMAERGSIRGRGQRRRNPTGLRCEFGRAAKDAEAGDETGHRGVRRCMKEATVSVHAPGGWGYHFCAEHAREIAADAPEKWTFESMRDAGGRARDLFYHAVEPARKAAIAGGQLRLNPRSRKPTRANTEVDTWFERDRAHVELRYKNGGPTIVEWWDEDVSQAVEDGFLNPRDYHGSALEYALEMGAGGGR